MSKHIKLKKGLDIKLYGEAEKIFFNTLKIEKCAIKPTDFTGLTPKLLVKEGDYVECGTPILFDKNNEKIKITSPASGTVSSIVRGEKRILREIIIDLSSEQKFIDFGKANPSELSKEEITEKLLQSGVWATIRQRPYSIIANPSSNPKAIFISGFDTSPLAPDYDFIVHGNGEFFQAGLDALSKLTQGKVYLNLNPQMNTSKVFINSRNVEINYFSGPHPAGNVGIQIHHIDPINKGDIVWYVNPQHVITIGRLFLEGKYNSSKIIAVTGSEVLNPKYAKVISGCQISGLIDNNVTDKNLRFISGNVLTGTKINKDGFLGFYDNQITVIPEGDYYEFFGWALPGFNKFSFSRTFFSWLFPNRKYVQDTNLHGGERAYVITGEYEKVLPMDILPMQLIKAILVEDIDKMEQLGIYEVDEEDFALVEYIDTSKTEIQSIIRKGLDLIRKEMS
jgi:Na+-transporting NADH:ubiquinone oxidoreductase subunit A